MNILVSTQLLSPYRTDWFNELAKYAKVFVMYLDEDNADRNAEWLEKRPDKCEYKLMSGRELPYVGKVSFDFIKEIKKNPGKYDIILLDGYAYLTQVVNLAYLNNEGFTYFVNVDGIVSKARSNMVIEKTKKTLLKKVPYYLCGSQESSKILEGYGADRARIIHHPFTSLFENDLFSATANDEEKMSFRKELGISEKTVIISVGRFSYLNGYGKGYDVLLKAAQQMSTDIGWYIVGGEPTEEFQKLTVENNLYNVHYIDFKPKEELKKYYRASDIFALMTIGDVWGLVINEAMACGLPVITTNKCVAGVELITNGENGYIIDVGDDKALVRSIKQILSDDRNAKIMGEKSIQTIKDYTIENMARIHIDTFKKILQNGNADT